MTHLALRVQLVDGVRAQIRARHARRWRPLRLDPRGAVDLELGAVPHHLRISAPERVTQHIVIAADRARVTRRVTLLGPDDRVLRVGGLVRRNPTPAGRIGVIFAPEMSVIDVRRTLASVMGRVRLDARRLADRVADALHRRDLDALDREELAEWLDEIFDELLSLGGDPDREAEWMSDLGRRPVEPPPAIDDLDPALIIGMTDLIGVEGRGVETDPASMPPLQLVGAPGTADWSAALAILRKNPRVTAGPLVRDDPRAPAISTHRLRALFFGDIDRPRIDTLAERLRLRIVAVDTAVAGLVTFEAPPGTGDEIDRIAEALLASGDVRAAEPVIGETSPAHGDFLAALQWDRQQIDLPRAHGIVENTRGNVAADIVACIVDGPMPLRPGEMHSPDLKSRDGGRSRLRCVDPVRQVEDHGAGHDPHGLHVAGVFGAGGRYGGADDGFGTVGVAPDAELVALRVPSAHDDIDGSLLWSTGLPTNRFGDFRPPAPADVIVCSRGIGALPPGTPLDPNVDDTLSPASAAVLRAIATRARGGRGALIFFSAGNAGGQLAIGAPYATAAEVMGCAASEVRAQGTERVWSGSNTGPALDLYAPGRLDGRARTLTVAPHMRAPVPARPLVELAVGAGPDAAQLDVARRTITVPGAIGVDLPDKGARLLLHDPSSRQFDAITTVHRRQVADGRWVYSWKGQVSHPYATGARVYIGDRTVGRLLADWQPGHGALRVPGHDGLRRATDVMLRSDGVWLAVSFDPARLDERGSPAPSRDRQPSGRGPFGAPFEILDAIVAELNDPDDRSPEPTAAPTMYVHPTTPIPTGFECRADRTEVWLSSSSAEGGFGSTSAANPLCAGVGALVLAIDPTFTAAEVARILRETAAPLDPPARFGAGRVDATRAVEQALRERDDRVDGRYRSDLYIAPRGVDGTCDAIRIRASDAMTATGDPGPDAPGLPVDQPRWVHVRVDNRGTEPSPPAWLRIVLAPAHPRGIAAHRWPDAWHPDPEADTLRQLGEVTIAPISGGSHRWIPMYWPPDSAATPARHLLVEVAPHDGPAAGGRIGTNDNLSGRVI